MIRTKKAGKLGAKPLNKKCCYCKKHVERMHTIIYHGLFLYHVRCYDKFIDKKYLKKQETIDFGGE